MNYLIDPTFTKVNRLFVLSFENEHDRRSFSKYYVPSVQIKDFNVLIDGKIFFDMPTKNEEEIYKQIIEIGRNSDYTTGNLLDFEYFSKHYNLLGNADNGSLKFATRKWYVINDQNNTGYGDGDENGTTIKFETKVIKSNLCAPFTKCVTHINDEHVDNADNLDIVMPMYNLIEYSDNY